MGLFLLAFGAGFAVLTIEIAGARLIAPIFGLSAVPWTAVIGVILAALAVGNHVGGRLADAGRVPLSALLVVAAVTAALPVLGSGVPWAARDVLGFIGGAVVTSVVLFAPSVLCLGAVVPYLVQADTESLGSVGRRAGDVSAAATAGSIAGTFVTGFFLLPAIPLPVLLGATAAALLLMAGLAGWILGSRLSGELMALGALGLGGAALTLPVALERRSPGMEIEVVEIDPVVTELARRHFAYGGGEHAGIRVVHDDARVFLRETQRRYDLVYLDVFDHLLTVPWTMVTTEALQAMADHLEPGGIFMANVLSPLEGPGVAFLQRLRATAGEVFPELRVYATEAGLDPAAIQNLIVVGATEAGALEELWSPKVVARVGDHLVKVAKVRGEFVWHAHEGEDELFLILSGRLRIEMEEGAVELGAGDVFVVPAGVRHHPVAEEECWLALVEPADTLHTGDVVTDRTRTIEEQMEGGS